MWLPSFPSLAMLLEVLAAYQNSNFCVLLSQVCYIAKTVARKSAHGKIFSAARITTACGKKVKTNEVPPHSPILPPKRAKGLQHCIHTSGTPHGTRLSREDNKKNLGLGHLCLNIPDSPGHPQLSSKAWDSESHCYASSGRN